MQSERLWGLREFFVVGNQVKWRKWDKKIHRQTQSLMEMLQKNQKKQRKIIWFQKTMKKPYLKEDVKKWVLKKHDP